MITEMHWGSLLSYLDLLNTDLLPLSSLKSATYYKHTTNGLQTQAAR